MQTQGPAFAVHRIVVPLQRTHGTTRHQGIAVDTQELVAKALLQLAQGGFGDMRLAGGATGPVLQFSFEVEEIGNRRTLGSDPVLQEQKMMVLLSTFGTSVFNNLLCFL